MADEDKIKSKEAEVSQLNSSKNFIFTGIVFYYT
jgi:hypothetical protein